MPGPPTQLLLRDVIRVALRNSTVILTLAGDVNLTGVTTLDPPIAATNIGQEEGKFNPKLQTGVSGSNVINPPSSFFGPGISTSSRYDQGTLYARLIQPITTGGELSLGYDPGTGYFFLPDGASSGRFNPAYSADFFFRVKQPLLKNAGTDRNLALIRVARAQTDQSRWDVQAALNSEIRSLSEAYWSLLAARIRLQALDSVIPLAEESVRLEKLRYQAEQVILADVARAEVAVEELIRARATSLQEYRRRNYQLNQLMGVSPSAATEVIPVDIPVREKVPADAVMMSSVALQRLPELARMRKQLEIRSLQLGVAYKDRLPDVNLLGEYRTQGLANNVSDALSQSASLGFPTTKFGVTFEYPLGNTTARSRAAAAEMLLTKDQLILKSSEDRAGYNISKLIANLDAAWERHESANRQVRQASEWLRLSGIRYKDPLPAPRGGNWLLLALVDFQNAMRGYVDAVSVAAETLAEYNTVLARLDEAQGVSMDRWAIELSDDGAAAKNSEAQQSTILQPAALRTDVAPSRTIQPAHWQGHSSYRDQHLGPRPSR